jgi:hypothetical protein
MKASDSTNSLTALNETLEEGIQTCFICIEELNEKQEPLVDSSLLRTCGCRFKVHPECWNAWMKDKTDFDCPICRKKSLSLKRPPTPPVPGVEEWPSEQMSRKKIYVSLACVFSFTAAGLMTYKIVTG